MTRRIKRFLGFICIIGVMVLETDGGAACPPHLLSPAELPKKIIVITGGTRGIGRALLDEFAVLGNTVIVCGRSKDEIDALSKGFNDPSRFMFSVVDVSSAEQTMAWADLAMKKFGTPDLVINNAGVSARALVEDMGPDEHMDIMKVNFGGVVNVTKAFLPAMKKKRTTSVIVNMTSMWGREVEAEMTAYCASKHAVEGFSASLAAEVAQQGSKKLGIVRVVPGGGVDTDMMRRTFRGARYSQVAPTEPMYIPPAQWARSAAPEFLRLSERNNGELLKIPEIQ